MYIPELPAGEWSLAFSSSSIKHSIMNHSVVWVSCFLKHVISTARNFILECSTKSEGFFFVFWKVLAKSKGSFVVKVGWDLAFQNHRNSNQRYPLSHQKLVNYMRKVVTDEFIGSSSVLDRHLQV